MITLEIYAIAPLIWGDSHQRYSWTAHGGEGKFASTLTGYIKDRRMVPQLLSPSRLLRWTGLRFAGGIFVGKWSRHMDNQHLRRPGLQRHGRSWPLHFATSSNGENEPGVQKPHQLRNGRTTAQSTQTGSLGAKEKIISFRNSPNNQWIGLREILQESPIFNGKIYGFL